MELNTFETIWNDGIVPEAKRIVNENTGLLVFNEGAKIAIYNRYNELNRVCKINFMFDSMGLLDRHKVCAALIIAIVQVRPLVSHIVTDEYGNYYAFNEKLAFIVALSVLAGYINKADNEYTIDEFVFPELSNSDEKYEDIFCKMIRLDSCYNQLSVLSIANILFLLEKYTLLSKTKRD